ncbi:HSP20 family protein [Arenibacter algicola]|jgi:HSP20 family protein|uniref:HSP20 family protein n=1 Tax=Arenibacter algicola TaxID=616991 RepID=A0A221V0U5_9FLAO|nr:MULTISPECIES: Hsp20/alpha crystallin family protein [Arenibacter]ASO06761.1 spore protein SP21 [Arenibacter algicola]MDX1767127.1 Hsp20/alpha crystallin family protein [Arenibacter troitsensis]GBF21097.1 spore protein SP21 [Arenibacter sp. NBRC 103722]HCO82743.1 Hsp20/alpha crystallin family protein [Arenibacter sp.]|tara:strand:- start:13194 stop:13619 length:426 start_codon:yes stop_codon:yes gene_type:complete
MSLVKRNNVMFPSLMNEILRPDWFGGIDNFKESVPAANVKETETEYVLELAIPGRKKEDFNVEIDNDILTISSEVKSEENKEDDGYTRREFTFSSFKRVFSLPETISLDKINATYEDGILKFVLPKKEEALPKPKRLIEIA